jgi:hypothetical protein
MDSILLLEAAEAEHSIWWSEVPPIQRFLRHPKIAGRYIARILELFETGLSQDAVKTRLDGMGSALSTADRRALENAVERRRRFVRSELSKTLDLKINGRSVAPGATVELDANKVALSGKAPQLGTLRVMLRLNGDPAMAADWRPYQGDWSAIIQAPPGRSRLQIFTEGVESPSRIEVTLLREGAGFAPEAGSIFLPRLFTGDLLP